MSKAFAGISVLREVDFVLRPGQVHALAGANGSGKSTLMKIIYGVHQPSGGTMTVDGQPVRLRSPRHALNMGIAAVPQELPLVASLSVAENVMFGELPTKGGVVSWGEMRRRACETLAQVDVDSSIDPEAPVASLDLAARQLVSIARTLAHGAGTIVFDEPTSSLDSGSARRLFATVHRLRDAGCSIGFISQRLDDIFEVADTVSVLRDGELVDTVVAASVGSGRVAEMMTGEAPRPPSATRRAPATKCVLSVENLCAGPSVRDVSFKVAPGEVVGLAGLPGSGVSEVLRAITGLVPLRSGRIYLDGTDISRWPLHRRCRAGIAYVSGDRRTEGLALAQSVEMNLTTGLHCRARLTARRPGAERRLVGEVVDAIGLVPPDPYAIVGTLSGGNQQKIVVGRWLMATPTLWVLSDPTRGVDIHARRDIHALIRSQLADTAAAVMESSDLQELLDECDRVVVVRGGRVVCEVDPAATSEHELLVATARTSDGDLAAVGEGQTQPDWVA